MLSEETINRLVEPRLVQQLVRWLARATLEEKLELISWLVAEARREHSPQDVPLGLIGLEEGPSTGK